MKNMGSNKTDRVLGIYTKLVNGNLVNKAEEAVNYGVNERSIQRDIDDIRNYLDANTDTVGYINSVCYDRSKKGYRLEKSQHKGFSNGEVLAICKILLGSRAFMKQEMVEILSKLITCCVTDKNQKLILELIKNEEFHYVEPRHNTKFIDLMWEIGQAIRECRYIEIDYFRMKDRTMVYRKLKPMAIMFSEYYFYLIAFIDDDEVQKDFNVINDSFPTIYRIDRIKKLTISDERFHIPYTSKFEEGEFRKRVQFMYGGKLHKVKFKFSGTDIDSLLDRLPTAQIISEKNGVYTVSVEVFGTGIDMWLKSQGNMIKMID